jgi:hypothetical protein
MRGVLLSGACLVFLATAGSAEAVSGGGLPYRLPYLAPRHNSGVQYVHALGQAEAYMVGLQRVIDEREGRRTADLVKTMIDLIQQAEPPQGCVGYAKFARHLLDAEKQGEGLALTFASVQQARDAFALFKGYRDQALSEFAHSRRLRRAFNRYVDRARKLHSKGRAACALPIARPPAPAGGAVVDCNAPEVTNSPNAYAQLSVSTSGAEFERWGTLSVTPPGETFKLTADPGSSRLFCFRVPATVTMQATADPGYRFTTWSTERHVVCREGTTSATCTLNFPAGADFYVNSTQYVPTFERVRANGG